MLILEKGYQNIESYKVLVQQKQKTFTHTDTCKFLRNLRLYAPEYIVIGPTKYDEMKRFKAMITHIMDKAKMNIMIMTKTPDKCTVLDGHPFVGYNEKVDFAEVQYRVYDLPNAWKNLQNDQKSLQVWTPAKYDLANLTDQETTICNRVMRVNVTK